MMMMVIAFSLIVQDTIQPATKRNFSLSYKNLKRNETISFAHFSQ